MDYKKSYLMLQIGVLGGAVIVFIGLLLVSKGIVVGNVLSVIGLVCMFGGLMQAFLFFKCPHCGRRFNIRGKRFSYCPSCGKKLDFDDIKL